MRRLTISTVILVASCAAAPAERSATPEIPTPAGEPSVREWIGPPIQLSEPRHFDVRGGVKILRDGKLIVGASCRFDLAVALDDERFSIQQGPVAVITRYPRIEKLQTAFDAMARMKCVIANIESFGGLYTVDAQDVAQKLAAIREPLQELFNEANMPAVGEALTGELAATQLEHASFLVMLAFTLAEGTRLEFLRTRRIDDGVDGLGAPLVTWVDEIDCPFSPGRCVVLELNVAADDPDQVYEAERDALRAKGVAMEISDEAGRFTVVLHRATGIPQQILLREQTRLSLAIGSEEGSERARDVTVVLDLIPR